MKYFFKILWAVMALAMLISLAGCKKDEAPEGGKDSAVTERDYAASLELNMASFTAKQEVTVKNFVDGDTVHFNVPEEVMESGVLKARFLAVNTPESTGKIEPYGKAASNFTKEKLINATSIIIESDNEKWNADSTGGRYLVWVWYKNADMKNYRNLNVELLQNGFAIASNTSSNIYGSICTDALQQAQNLKIGVFSGQKDPDFYDGAAIELTLRELRTNIESYKDILVAFDCVITSNSNDTVYVEQYDAETDMYYGISVYYGNSGIGGDGLRILNIGNRARIVGKVQYYETGETWQISGLKYRAMKPDDPENIKLISSGHSAAYTPVDADKLVNGKCDLLIKDAESGIEELKTFDFAKLAMNTSVSMNDLLVESAHTTEKEGSSSNGAMTLSCTANGITVTVRTAVLRNAEGNILTSDTYIGKTIDVKGIIDYFDGNYQIKVFTPDQIIIN